MVAAADRRSAAADKLAAGHTAAVDKPVAVGNLAVMDAHLLMV